MQEKIKKLPKWAQELLKSKDREISSLTTILTGFKNNNPKSNVSYAPETFRDEVYLPDRVNVKFNIIKTHLGKEFSMPVFIRLEDNKLIVQGYTTLVIKPCASNHVTIEEEL
jgi:hypothetical protein